MNSEKSQISQSSQGAFTVAEMLNSLVSSIQYLLRKWWIIGLVSVLAGVLGVAIAWLQKPRYESRLTFALEESGGNLSGALSLAAEFGFNLGSGKDIFEGDNIIGIFSSRRMIERALLSPDTNNGKVSSFADYFLAIHKDNDKKTGKTGRLDTISFPYGQPRSSFSYLQDSLLYVMYDGIVKADLSVSKPDKKQNIFEIKFISPEERFSKVFTERLVDETIAFYTELRSKRSKETLVILENRVAELKGSLNNAISSRTSIQDANVNPAFASAAAPLQKKQVDISVYGGAYGELYKNLELARYQYLKSIPLLQIIDEPRYPMKKIKKGRLMTGIIFSVAGCVLFCFFLLLRRQWRMIVRQSDSNAEV